MGSWSAALREKMMPYAWYRWLVFCNVTMGTFMMNVDSSIVSVALPALQNDFQVSTSMLQWVISGYFLMITAIVPLMGKLSDLFGRKYFFMIGASIFAAGSALCASSGNIEQLIAYRIVQSFGSSMIMGNVMSIVAYAFPAGERGRPLGMMGSVVAVASICGPSIGGVLIGHWGWRSVFWINVPIGILSVLLASVLLNPLKSEYRGKEKFDGIGGAFFFVAMTSLLLFISNGHLWGWTGWLSILSIAISIVAWTVFIRWEARTAWPLIELNLFKNRNFAVGNVTNFFSFVLMMFPAFLLPLFFSRILHMSSFEIGLLMTPQAVAMIVSSPAGGSLGDRFGHKWPASFGLMATVASMVMMAQFDENTGYAAILTALILSGIGLGMVQSPNNVMVMDSVPIEKAGLTGGILATVRNFGKVSGVALAVFLFGIELGTVDTNPSFVRAVSFTFYVGSVMALANIFLYFKRISRPSKHKESVQGHSL